MAVEFSKSILFVSSFGISSYLVACLPIIFIISHKFNPSSYDYKIIAYTNFYCYSYNL